MKGRGLINHGLGYFCGRRKSGTTLHKPNNSNSSTLGSQLLKGGYIGSYIGGGTSLYGWGKSLSMWETVGGETADIVSTSRTWATKPAAPSLLRPLMTSLL